MTPCHTTQRPGGYVGGGEPDRGGGGWSVSENPPGRVSPGITHSLTMLSASLRSKHGPEGWAVSRTNHGWDLVFSSGLSVFHCLEEFLFFAVVFPVRTVMHEVRVVAEPAQAADNPVSPELPQERRHASVPMVVKVSTVPDPTTDPSTQAAPAGAGCLQAV